MYPSMPEVDHSRGSAGSNKIHGMIQRVPLNAVDEARLSTGSDTIRGLKAQLNAVPEVRQQKVDGLRQAVESGSYEVSAQRIAAAMLADLGRKLA
jgi:flagellar biosynthesis anti-sigma factor FlgM